MKVIDVRYPSTGRVFFNVFSSVFVLLFMAFFMVWCGLNWLDDCNAFTGQCHAAPWVDTPQ